jgi:lactate dehydrogenase-like 2-hydroxyacid dehydrogenase
MTLKPDLLLMGPFPSWDMDALEDAYHVHRWWEIESKDTFLAENGPAIRAIATRGDLGASAALINALPQLEIIACYGVGVDAIDVTLARQNRIAVTYTPDILTGDVADLAIALCLAVARQIPAGEQHVRSGAWKSGTMPIATRFFGKRMGIIGLGRIGEAIAQRARAFDMTVAYHNRRKKTASPYPYFESPEDLAAQSDFLVAALSGGSASQGLVSEKVLLALGPHGYFINVSRGAIVDEAALIHALEQGIIKGAALDVFLNEPNINERFFGLPNVVLQPHVGSATVETRKAMGQLVRDNLAAHFSGTPLLTPVP